MQAAFDDAAFQQAFARRGITELGSVVLFPWTAGNGDRRMRRIGGGSYAYRLP